MSVNNQDITKSAVDDCIQNEGDQHEAKCKWVMKAHDMATEKTSLDKERTNIENDLVEAPRVPAKKICCSCPTVKRYRDNCFMENGQDHAACQHILNAYRLCLYDAGFSKEQCNL